MRCRGAAAATLALLAVSRWCGGAAGGAVELAPPREAADEHDASAEAHAGGEANEASAAERAAGEAEAVDADEHAGGEEAEGSAAEAEEHAEEHAADEPEQEEAHLDEHVEDAHHAGEEAHLGGEEAHHVEESHHGEEHHDAEGHHADGDGHDTEGHHADGDGHDAEGHHGDHEQATDEQLAVGKALAYTLMGSVAWIMFFFYQLNSSDKDIVHATWRILYDMISIFVAVLIFQTLKVITVEFFGEDAGHHSGPPDNWTMFIASARLVVMYVFCSTMLFFSRFKEEERLWSLKVVAGIGGHAVGFAAIDVFGNLLETNNVRGNLAFQIVLVAMTIVFLSTVFFLHEKGLERKGCDEEFLEVRAEFENDAACLCLGLETSMIVREVISGKMPSLHGDPQGHSSRECLLLLCCSAVFGVFVVGISNTLGNLRRHKHFNRFIERLLEMLQLTTSLTMGWCLLFWGQWYFWYLTDNKGVGNGAKMIARLIQSLVATVLCFLAIRIVDFFADHANHHTRRGLRELLKVFGLLMGLTWESCFLRAVEDIAAGAHGEQHTYLVSGIAFMLVAVVVPAWALYILPHVIDDEEEEKKEDEEESSDSLEGLRDYDDEEEWKGYGELVE